MENAKQVQESEAHAWPITVREVAGEGGSATMFEASLPFRQVSCFGTTRDGAIGSLIACYANLAWRGSIDPRSPERVGLNAIQHAIEMLEERLRAEVDGRGATINFAQQHEVDGPDALPSLHNSPNFARRNEVISGIATAIAALARVKEL